MKAIRIHETGATDKMRYEDVAEPTPAAGQLLIKMAAAGVNYIDTYHRSGLYKLPLPLILGQEGAGTVEAVGADVKGFAPGDRVAFASTPGCYAEKAVIPAAMAVKVPSGLDLKKAAAAMLQGMTAHYLVHSTYKLEQGSTCLIHAAAGGVGLVLVQMAKNLGATVIGTVSTPAKAEKARQAGADHTILYTEQDFEVELKKFVGGKGVDVVYDSVGATTFLKSLNCLRPRGMMCTFGNASGPAPAIEPLLLTQKGSLFLSRPKLGDHLLTRQELEWRAGDVLSAIAAGKLTIHIEKEYPLSQAAQAHQDLESRKTTGKLLLIPE